MEARLAVNGNDWLPQINQNRCTGCGDCIAVCPTGALELVDGKASVAHPDACTYCAMCEDICPAYAIGLPLLICFAPGSTGEQQGS